MATGIHEMAGAVPSSGSYYYYATVDAAHALRRQWSTPAAAFAPSSGTRGRGDHHSSRNIGSQYAPAARGAGGVGAVARALWAWVARGRRKVLRRSGSAAAKEQYGHEEYAQNFDDGAAAAEPENLSRSFSARYAGRRLAC